ncbi:MAG TPA: phosphoribosylaminoimidazolesuccinocarboxamide synthase [Spirochaetia bacterium]|nr:phosphoribosylaminoimidazolesuccinocarboxamide synthase [Spirochaetia bacterium]
MRAADIDRLLDTCLERLALPTGALRRGKVRDVVELGDELLIVTTDRISAFDRVLTTIPCKGEVLNTLSLHWFRATADIVPNHVREEVSARTVRAVHCDVLPVEVVVRGYLTGSAWRDYQKGSAVSGITLPPGMRFNQRFERPLLTPSTKEMAGVHDRPISREEILGQGLVPRATWEQVEEASLALFRRGTELAARQGLILVDTKYEFGIHRGQLVLADELHTPDSSRYWYADTYAPRFASGEPQRELDKEYLRQWLLARGWSGDGAPPAIPDDVRRETAGKYIDAWEKITGQEFVPRAGTEQEELSLIASRLSAGA